MTAKLTEDQARHVQRAREVLTQELKSGSAADYAERVGALEWQLGEMLALVGQLTGIGES